MAVAYHTRPANYLSQTGAHSRTGTTHSLSRQTHLEIPARSNQCSGAPGRQEAAGLARTSRGSFSQITPPDVRGFTYIINAHHHPLALESLLTACASILDCGGTARHCLVCAEEKRAGR